jgi:hypothetical protein
MQRVAWFYRAVEQADGSWSCQRDLAPIDEHATINDALAHLFKLAEEDAPAYLYAHWLDGRVQQMGDVDTDT